VLLIHAQPLWWFTLSDLLMEEIPPLLGAYRTKQVGDAYELHIPATRYLEGAA
jgi:hypothetical protein